MKKLIVHIGHGKTGSSFLQSILALNSERMEQLGFFYPEHPSNENAKKVMISSGNGIILLEKDSFDTSHPNIILSSELLFRHLANNKERVAILAKCHDLEVVLYLRDVIDHRVSQWGQWVKRAGGYTDLNTFLATHKYDVLNYVLYWINLSKEIDFKLTLRNYSKCKNYLAQDFFNYVLELPELTDNLTLPSTVVNRSLSHSELEIQRVFNAAYGKESSKYISDFLCNNFPRVEPWKPILSEQTYESILSDNEVSLDAINSVLDESMHLEIGSKEKWVNGESEEIKTLENEICKDLGASIREGIKHPSSIDLLREVALRLYYKTKAQLKTLSRL